MKRRTLLGGAGVVGLAGLAGCLGDVTEHEASPYGVDEATKDGADYDRTGVDAVVIEEDVGVGPIEETVVATNYVVEHEKTLEMGPLGEQRGGVFITFATPQVSVFGREFNPVADMDTEELIDLVQDNYDDIEDVEHDEDADVEVLGETVTRSRFVGEATFDGSSVDVDLHVTEAAAPGDDLVVAIGVYPRDLRDREEEDTIAMIEGIDPAAADANDADDNEEDGDETEDGEDGETEDEDGDETEDDETEDDGDDALP